MEFTFPVEEFGSVESLEEAKRIINGMLEFENLSAYCSYNFQLIRGIYIYCRCRYCPARLVLRKKENMFVLIKSNTLHKHKKILPSKVAVIEAIQGYPSCFNLAAIKDQIMKRFNISPATFYRRYRDSQHFGHNLEDVLITLESSGVFGVKITNPEDEDQELPSLLLLTSEAMIENYHQNGKNVKFDLTYNLIREKGNNEQQFAVGVFLSLNNNFNIQPHCLVIMKDESKLSFVRLFTEFFILMKAPPNCVTTDEQKNIHLALEELRERSLFTGHHFIDVFHVLRNTKKALFNKPSISYLISLSRSSHSVEYRHRRSLCLEKLCLRDKEILDKFDEKMERCCVALLPPVFIGLNSTTTSASEKINDIIKQRIPYSQKYISVVGTLSKLLVQMTARPKNIIIQKMKIEQLTTITEIEELRIKLNKRVFRKLMMEMSISITCLINLTDNSNTYEVVEQDLRQATFLVKFISEGKWVCECELSEKIGLPCSHILKVILLLKQRIHSSINSWWIFNEGEVLKNGPNLSCPRKTRRHIR